MKNPQEMRQFVEPGFAFNDFSHVIRSQKNRAVTAGVVNRDQCLKVEFADVDQTMLMMHKYLWINFRAKNLCVELHVPLIPKYVEHGYINGGKVNSCIAQGINIRLELLHDDRTSQIARVE